MTLPPMPPPGPGRVRLRREDCVALDVSALVKTGFLGAPGYHRGTIRLPGRPGGPVLAVLVKCSEPGAGVVAAGWDDLGRVRVVRVPTRIGPRWSSRLVCPCGRPARKLFRPGACPGPWACRFCWGLRYRGGRRPHRRQAPSRRV